jgi:thymidylate kinase
MKQRSANPLDELCALLKGVEGYALLRNPDVVGNLQRGGDVDLLVYDSKAFARLLVKRLGPPLMEMRRSYVHGLFWRWGHVDLLPTVEWHGAAYVPESEVFGKTYRNSQGLLESSTPVQATVCWFSSLMWGGRFKDRYRELIVQAARDKTAEQFRELLIYAVGKRWGSRLFAWAQRGEPERSVKYVQPLRRSLWWRSLCRSPWRTLIGWVDFWAAETKLRLFPPAPWVAILGLDGSGKSSVLEALESSLGRGRPFIAVQEFHWRPGFFRKCKDTGPVVNPHGKPPRGVLVSTAKLVFLLVDWFFGYWLRLVHLRAKGILVIFDRHFMDLYVDRMRYRYGGLMWTARLAGALIPKPDLFIVLDLPAEVAHARKPEIPLENAKRLREGYLELARSLPNAHVVDASRPLGEVVREVEEILLAEMRKRTKKRLKRLGLV